MDQAVVAVCDSNIIILVEIVIRLTYFIENDVNDIALILCDYLCVIFVQPVSCKLIFIYFHKCLMAKMMIITR
jgi:hypothetical protein